MIGLIFGLFLNVSPLSYLRIQRVVPWIALTKRPANSGAAEWRKWMRRTRLTGLVLILIGLVLLHAAYTGKGGPYHPVRTWP